MRAVRRRRSRTSPRPLAATRSALVMATTPCRSPARRAARGARASARAGRHRRRRRAARHRSRPPRRACCRRAGRARGRRRSRARSRRGASGGRIRRRWSCPRRRSSGSRSASMPVSARSSVVLPWSMWPAVPTTTVIGRQRRRKRRRDRAGEPSSRGSTVRRSSTTRSSSIRPTTGRVAARSAASSRSAERTARATPDDGSVSPGSEPPPTVERSSTPRRAGADRVPPTALGPRSQLVRGRRDHPPDRDLGSTASPARYSPSVAATRGERRLVRPHRARQRVAPHPGDEVGATDDQPGLRPADELVAAERDEVRAGGQPLAPASARARARSAPCRAARRSPGRRSTIAPCAMGELGDLGRIGRLGEAGHARSSTGGPAGRAFARPSASGASKSAARVRFVVPTSIEPRARRAG